MIMTMIMIGGDTRMTMTLMMNFAHVWNRGRLARPSHTCTHARMWFHVSRRRRRHGFAVVRWSSREFNQFLIRGRLARPSHTCRHGRV